MSLLWVIASMIVANSGLCVAFTRILKYPIVGNLHRLTAIFDDSVDISPAKDGGIYKRVIKRGNPNKGHPLIKDTVQIAWKMYRRDGTIAHDSNTLEEPFDFTIGAEPRHVILGWDIAVQTMFEGEIASYVIIPSLAFGEKGLPIFNIEPNTTFKCDLELVRIKPSVLRSYPTVGLNESIKDELMAKIDSGESVITQEVMENKQVNATKTDEQRKYFDSTRHKIDPNQRVRGEGRGHVWEETPSTMEIEIPLPLWTISDGREPYVYTKHDLRVEIQSNTLMVELIQGGGQSQSQSTTPLMQGPLHGKILPSESMWALLPPDPLTSMVAYRGCQRVLVSLEKAFGSKDIWATVLQRGYLGEKEVVEGVEEEENNLE